MMRRHFACALAVALIPILADTVTPAAAGNGTACTNLAALTIPSVTIRSATAVPAGPFTAPGARQEIQLPAFCRVEATARPTSDSEIKFEVWIPPTDSWNGKFQGVGNGGYQGSITYTAIATALRKGYATASTATGHAGDDMKLAHGHPEKIVHYAHPAIHVMTATSELRVR